jgi:hypothetical protein
MRDESIHPRVENGRTRYKKVNTCLPPSQTKRERLIEVLSQRVEEHPRDLMAISRLKSLTNEVA